MTEEEKIALEAKIDAITLAINSVFNQIPSGHKARDALISGLQQKIAEAVEGSPRESALLVELARWKGRST